MREVTLEPLTRGAFAAFGDVVDAPEPGGKFVLDRTLATLGAGLSPRLTFNHAKPWSLPLEVTRMERHNRSCQCWIPLDVSRWVVTVAADRNGAPDPGSMRAFLARSDQAVNYHVGVWHHPLRTLDRSGRFAILMWTTGERGQDEEWADIPATRMG